MSKQKFRHKNTPFFVFSYQYPINSFKSFALTVRNFSLSSLIILVSMYLDTQLVLCPLTVNYRIIEQLYITSLLTTSSIDSKGTKTSLTPVFMVNYSQFIALFGHQMK